MSAEILDTTGGILTVRIAGTLTHPELRAVQKSAAEILQRQGRMRILVLAEGFQGWARGGDWGDLSLQAESDPFIKKMAIVGEQKWEDLAVLFAAKGFRQFPVEYFPPAGLGEARAWLAAAP
ncbi:MAG: STAS/SEC14 domain-containing protein [Verrucomicrobiae bacterium]|nr:STAS/SEC14 domain-containing protein [Verrucomicrobiae bacterium]